MFGDMGKLIIIINGIIIRILKLFRKERRKRGGKERREGERKEKEEKENENK